MGIKQYPFPFVVAPGTLEQLKTFLPEEVAKRLIHIVAQTKESNRSHLSDLIKAELFRFIRFMPRVYLISLTNRVMGIVLGDREYLIYRSAEEYAQVQAGLQRDPNDDCVAELHAIFNPQADPESPLSKQILLLARHVKITEEDNLQVEAILQAASDLKGNVLGEFPLQLSADFMTHLFEGVDLSKAIYYPWIAAVEPNISYWNHPTFGPGLRVKHLPPDQALYLSQRQLNRLGELFGQASPTKTRGRNQSPPQKAINRDHGDSLNQSSCTFP